MAACKFWNEEGAAILSVWYADSEPDINCSDDEGEQESVPNDNIQVESDTEN